MKLKSSRSAVATVSALATLLSLLFMERLGAQSPTSTPTPPRPKMGYVRFWNAIPPGMDITLELLLGAGPDARLLKTATPGNFYANYSGLTPGQCALHVCRSGDRQNIIKSLNLQLRDRNYFTLLATQQPDGQISVELIDETPDPTKAPNNRVTVRQFAVDTTVVITAGANYRTDSLLYGKTETLEGLPDGVVPLKMHAVKSGTSAVKTWDSQADFRVSHHSTLFIVNDFYGRIRARVAMDGPSPAEEAAAAAEAKATP